MPLAGRTLNLQRERAVAIHKTVMIVDDDKALAEMLSIVLEAEDFEAVICLDGVRAVEMFPIVQPAIVLLDVMLPGLNGVEVARLLREHSDVPIVMLTAKSDTQDVVLGLEAGADDYIAKPFKAAELIARIRARLRSVAVPAEGDGSILPDRIVKGGVSLSRSEHVAMKFGKQLALTPVEFDLLYTLALFAGEALRRDQLLRKVWGYEHAGDTRLVNVHVQRLRQKIEDDPEFPSIVQTVRGIGYKFVPPKMM
ncbi:MtrAB system response regulator MtrA [Bifidobacterium psychraerophilum]|uniref:MtrAB system response regulator MtrA n=1 Tax=Bifidobacterium psychraerophilum TaxID=218140 RepID=UPI003DA6DBA5